jgi:OOP family OmpA-OmpF porin
MHLLAGIGLEYGLDNGLAVRGEFVAHETDAKYAQLGLIYRFNGSGDSVPETLPELAITEADIDLETQLSAELPEPTDKDGDGVADLVDRCLTTPSGLPVKSDGCAIFDGAIEGIAFETSSDTLTAEALVILEDVARTLAEYPDIKVTIEAHTDNLGTAASNLQLSKRRAIAVARYLVDQNISGARLSPQAFGESKPRMSNATKKGRSANRRVEFSVL